MERAFWVGDWIGAEGQQSKERFPKGVAFTLGLE